MNAALPSGNVPEARLDRAGTALPEIWLAGGATGLAGYSSADGSQHLFIAGTASAKVQGWRRPWPAPSPWQDHQLGGPSP